MELLNCGTTSDAVHLWRSMGCKDVWELMTTKAFGELAPPVQARFKTIASCLEGLYKAGPTSYNNNSNGGSKANGAGEEEEVSRLEVVIAGAGPSGLRLAISQAAMGAKVTIWEKRQSCTRRNVLHLWTSTLADLKAIGARAVNPKLGNGPIHHASIRELQRVLMIIALLAGARVELEVQYAGHRRATHQEQQQQQQHQSQQQQQQPPSSLPGLGWVIDGVRACDGGLVSTFANVLVGADGEHSLTKAGGVARSAGFRYKTFCANQAVGLVMNLDMENATPRDRSRLPPEIPGSACYANKAFYSNIKQSTGLQLENFVYYQNETHYIVCTPSKTSLVELGVCNDRPTVQESLERENVNVEALQQVARRLTNFVKIPETAAFCHSHNGHQDIQLFDFTSKTYAERPFTVIRGNNTDKEDNNNTTNTSTTTHSIDLANDLLVVLVGDALVGSFWPQGTGANRGVLGALNASEFISCVAANPGDTAAAEAELEALYRTLKNQLDDAAPRDRAPNNEARRRFSEVRKRFSMTLPA